MMDAPRERHFRGPVLAAVAGALEGFQLGELGLPVAQDMLRDAELSRQFADGTKGVRGLVGGRHLFAYLTILSRIM